MRFATVKALCVASFLSFGINLNAVQTPEEELKHKAVVDSQKQASLLATHAWLNLTDSGNYDASWETASNMMKRTVTKKEWNQIMEATRKDLGSVKSRTLAQELPAQNPHNMPRGDYMVVLFQTSFSNKQKARELLTLSYEYGDWKVITYMIE